MQGARRAGVLAGMALQVGLFAAGCASERAAPAVAPSPEAESAANAAPTAAPMDRFRHGYLATLLSYFYLLLGEDTGLYRRESLAPEPLQIPASTRLAALLAGEVDYSAGAAGGVRLAVRDRPVRLLSTVSLLNFRLIAQPDINGGATLRGKAVGVGSRGASADRAAQRAPRSLGLDPAADVALAVIPDQPLQLEALRAGQVGAIMSSPPRSVQATRDGFRVLASTADLEPNVIGGVVATTASLEGHRDRARRLPRAESAIVRYFKSEPAETIAVMMTSAPG